MIQVSNTQTVEAAKLLHAVPLTERLETQHALSLLPILIRRLETAEHKAALIASKNCPPEVLAAWTSSLGNTVRPNSGDLELAVALSGNTKTPPASLEVLSRASNLLIKLAIAANTSSPINVLDALAKDKNWEVRQQVAYNTATSEHTLNFLLKDIDSSVFQAALRNPTITVEKFREYLGEKPDLPTIRAAAHYPKLPTDLALAWANHPEPSVRSAVASNSSLPGETLWKLIQKESHIEVKVAENLNIPSDLAIFLASKSENLDTRAHLARNPNIPIEAAIILLVDSSPLVRRQTALNQLMIPSQALKQAFLEEGEPRVVAALALHPNIESEVLLKELAREIDTSSPSVKSVGRALAYSNKSLTPELIQLIAGAGDEKSLAGLVSRPDCPTKIFMTSVTHLSFEVRRAIAANPDCPKNILDILSTDSDAVTALLAQTHPSY